MERLEVSAAVLGDSVAGVLGHLKIPMAFCECYQHFHDQIKVCIGLALIGIAT